MAEEPIYANEAKQISGGAANNLFSPSPQRGSMHEDEDSDDEDPEDNVDGAPTLSMWGEYLDEVFEERDCQVFCVAYAGRGHNNLL
ncbi:hypothetical protein JG687_00016740 [Phytophthora cactorum]|uniref:Uncharacterized protein n=1 Tax=Phytophthora cactorum TaxID=29920 RepID=A0A8T1TSD2_9STRA|nr:hypothetical protein JG687_00016740 [Phytophthora cactorum]